MIGNKYFVGIMSVFIAIVIVGSVLVPVVNGSMDGFNFDQSGDPVGIRLAKQTSSFSLNMSVEYDDQDNIIVQNDTDVQTIAYGTQILMASDNSVIYAVDSSDPIVIWDDGTSKAASLNDDFTAVITGNELIITVGENTMTLPIPTTYLFVPNSEGYYRSFLDGGIDKIASDPVVAVSEIFAGVIAYNDISVGGYVDEIVNGTSTVINDVTWGSGSAPVDNTLDFDPSQIVFNPIDIDPGNVIMTVPTPTYTDGDWGYELSDGNATIVSYSGAAGDITVPSTVGGYPVIALGKGGNDEQVFPTTLSDFTVTLPSSITRINSNAFRGCTGLKTVTIPNSVTFIGNVTFRDCSGLSSLVLPEGLTSIEGGLVMSCSSLSSLVIPKNVSSFGNNVFYESGITELLNLSGVEIPVGAAVPDSTEVRTSLSAAVYLSHITQHTGNQAFNNILGVIPVIVLAAILVATAGIMLLRRE